MTALRALYGWALPRGMARVNPTSGLRLPTGGQARDRIASPPEASKLIGALAPLDQAALGLAVYAGLRLGEILALQWSAIDLDAGTLRVLRSWDHGAHEYVAPKSKAGTRTVPIIERLALLLADHRVLTDHRDGLLFPGRGGERPVSNDALRGRMRRAWTKAGMAELGLHEARHTFASLMIAAGVNAKALATYLGHANIAITFDRYGHLMPGNEAQARGLAAPTSPSMTSSSRAHSRAHRSEKMAVCRDNAPRSAVSKTVVGATPLPRVRIPPPPPTETGSQ